MALYMQPYGTQSGPSGMAGVAANPYPGNSHLYMPVVPGLGSPAALPFSPASLPAHPLSAPQHQTSAVSQVELAAGIESLYRDQLRPYGRILRKRLAEITQAAGRSELELGVKELRTACEACQWLHVEDSEGADWSALIAGRRDTFVDVYSPDDVYPEAMWNEAIAYFNSLTDAQMVLPGGRYSCAQVLMSRNLAFLQCCSLGQVCHIVQLAISQKKILGYLNGTVVPYGRSQSMVKERHAVCQQPCSGGTRSRGPVASWEVLRASLQELIQEVASTGSPIPLSNIKRLFRSKFHVELSETALGYAKVSELLQDSRLSDLCEVKLQGHGYVITARRSSAKKAAGKRSFISLADSLCLGEVGAPPVAALHGAPLVEPPAPSSGLLRKRDRFNKPSLCMESILTPEELDPMAYAAGMLPVAVQAAFPPTPSPSAGAGRALPRLLGTQRHRPPCGLAGESVKAANGVAAVTAVAQGKSFSDAPLAPPPAPPAMPPPQIFTTPAPETRAPPLDEALIGDTVSPQTGPNWALLPLTPSTMGILSSVHNTFISVPPPPPTPVKSGSRARARSLPKDS